MTELVRWSDLGLSARDLVRDAISHGFDTPVSGADSGEKLIAVHERTSVEFWVVFYGDEPVGVFRLRVASVVDDALETATYLIPAARGRGINRAIKHSAARAAHRADTTLVSTIRQWNERSQHAMRNVLPSVVPAPLWHDGEAKFLYIISMAGDTASSDDDAMTDAIAGVMQRWSTARILAVG